jgi:hypothetical protein
MLASSPVLLEECPPSAGAAGLELLPQATTERSAADTMALVFMKPPELEGSPAPLDHESLCCVSA